MDYLLFCRDFERFIVKIVGVFFENQLFGRAVIAVY
jgi:hypothetical protein